MTPEKELDKLNAQNRKHIRKVMKFMGALGKNIKNQEKMNEIVSEFESENAKYKVVEKRIKELNKIIDAK